MLRISNAACISKHYFIHWQLSCWIIFAPGYQLVLVSKIQLFLVKLGAVCPQAQNLSSVYTPRLDHWRLSQINIRPLTFEDAYICLKIQHIVCTSAAQRRFFECQCPVQFALFDFSIMLDWFNANFPNFHTSFLR